ncbi:MAG: bacillithiol system redox-active protein YtxJ [Flavobacteriaceae bacterium]|nr:bacillithiol system redox-active protein YtxJ [Flavobacteriaceae bacterium]
MSLLKKIFGETASEEPVSKVNWILLTEISQLETISKSEKTVGIFKHSTRCYTSKVVLREFEKDFDVDGESIDMYFLDLIAYRSISDEITKKYNLCHESPQLLIIKKDTLVASDSHMEIVNLEIASFI